MSRRKITSNFLSLLLVVLMILQNCSFALATEVGEVNVPAEPSAQVTAALADSPSTAPTEKTTTDEDASSEADNSSSVEETSGEAWEETVPDAVQPTSTAETEPDATQTAPEQTATEEPAAEEEPLFDEEGEELVFEEVPVLLLAAAPVEYDLAQYITGGSISINGVELKSGSTTTVDYGSVVCDLQWKFPNGLILNPDDTFVYTLPNNINFAPVSGALMNGTESVGTYTISGNKITLHYTNENFMVEGQRSGTVRFNGTLDKSATDNNNGGSASIVFPGVATFPINVNRDSTGDGVSVTKSKSGGTALQPEYVIAVTATGAQSNVSLNDTMGKYLTMDQGSVKFYTDAGCTSPYSGSPAVNTNDKGFSCTIPQMNDGQTVYVKYSATVSKEAYAANYDYGNTSVYQNTVKATSNEDQNGKTTSVVLNTSMNWGSKSGTYNANTNTIHWTVDIAQNNPNGVDYGGTTISDIRGDGVGTPTNIKIMQNYSNDVTNSMSGLKSAIENGTSYTFPSGSTGVYRIEYDTPLPAFDSENAKDFTNTLNVDPFGEAAYRKTYPATVTVGNDWQYIEKECLTKGAAKTVEWKVTLHVKAGGTNNSTLKDTLPSGMSYVDGSLTVTGATATNVTAANGVLSYNLGNLAAGDYTITYKTSIDGEPQQNAEYKNTAVFSANNKELGSADSTYKYVSTQYLAKDGDWNNQADPGCTRWELTISPIADATSVVIKDTLPTNMAYAEGLKISVNWSDQTGAYASDVTVTSGDGTVSFEIKGALLETLKTTAVKISYQTKPINGAAYLAAGNKEYTNAAQISVDGMDCPTVTASRWLNPNNKLLEKKYNYTENTAPYVDYTVTVNPEALDLLPDSDTLVLQDTFSGALSFQRGSLLINDEAPSADQYKYNAETKVLTITVPDSKKVTVKYSALLDLPVGEKLNAENASNTCSLSGVDAQNTSDSVALQGVALKSAGTSTSVGVSIRLYKYANENQNIPLKGATFTLYEVTLDDSGNETGSTKVKSGATSDTGYVTFSGLYREHVYKIVETAAPTGYAIDSTPLYVVFNNPEGTKVYPKSVASDGKSYPLQMSPSSSSIYQLEQNNNLEGDDVGKLVITKTIKGDVTADEAEGALKFKVTAPDDTFKEYTLEDFTNDGNGKYTLELDKLAVGDYTVEETTSTIDGKTVTVKYKVNGGEQTEGTSAKAGVEKDTETTVDFEDDYTKDVGKLIITKTIKGDVTEEEAEGALKFKVTAPDDTFKEYTLEDFTNDGNGKYTLELDKLAVGDYNVEETTSTIDGKTVTVKYKVNGGEQTEGTSAKAGVTKDTETTVDFEDDYTKDVGKLVITKTIKGDVTADEAEGALKFKVTAPDDTFKEYTLEDFTNDGNGKYTLELDKLAVGDYTVEETTSTIDGKTVTVKYKVNGGEQTEGTSAKAGVTKDTETTVDFEDDYTKDVGKLVITKTIKGDVTADEAEGALKFKVTAPDDTFKEYTLEDFTNDGNGKYTLELDKLAVGDYTVEETTSTIDGKTVTVKYKVNGGEQTEGTSAKAGVEKDTETTVDFEDDYTKDVGKLVITKTIKGDVTADEAEGALKFKVTAPDDTFKEYTLEDFTNDGNGKYTLELDKLAVGDYTVEETTSTIDGKTVTVKYKVNGGEQTEGTSAKAGVEKDTETTVDFEDDYTKDVGKLVITKTIKGDVTADEAEGALKFKVTAPDDTFKEYTLEDFTNDGNGKYTLELDKLAVGDYTVEETTSTIDGKTVTVKYKVNGGEQTEGTSAKAGVEKDTETKVDFENDYVGDVGKLVITKTIKGDVTADEAEGALKFKVTAPDDTFKEYTLEDFTNDGNGKYTLELDKLAVGDYTVEETTSTIDGKTVTVKYKVNGGEQTEGTSAKAGVEKDTETKVDFENDYVGDVGKLVITKTIKGDVTADEAEGALKFKVTAPNGTSTDYTLKNFTNDGNGKYTLELKDVAVGEYTVEETTSTIDGKTVTVKYKVNGGEQTEGTSAKAGVEKDTETTVDFEDDYTKDVGKLVITKTIKGDVTEEEAEGALKFKVTAPDDTFKEYTLEDFTNDGNGKYTLELDKLAVGDYTVEETTSTIDGKTVTVKYKVNGGEQTEGTSAKAGVEKDTETTVDFENDYTKDVGKLVITKTIKGDVTADEAEGALKFKVTAPDDTFKEYTLDDFTNDGNGKYTLELDKLAVGDYTVEETTSTIDGKTVTVKYKVNGGEQTEGTSAKAGVEKDTETTVDFEDDYTKDVGKLVITKTIKGDVTADEAEGALKFKVTAPDDTFKEYTLEDFTNDGNGKYTLELDKLAVGDYTVEETTSTIDGKTVTVKYKVNGGEQTEGTSAKAGVEKDTETTVDFEDDYTKDVGKLVITKTIKGDVTADEAEGALKFKVTAPDDTFKEYTLEDFTNDGNGKYTLELDKLAVGDYTVEETTSTIDGKTVTVKYKVNGGEQTEGTSAKAGVEKDTETKVDFENDYVGDVGKLVITKTIKGDVTADEAEGALKFKVTAPDDTFKEYTLEDFTNDGNGKYTLELDKLAVGDYTVEETTSTIDGKTVTVKYKVNGGEQTEGTSAKAGVEKDTETTVDFEDDYTKDVGKLVITKTIKGDVTADEAEGALKFKVTAPDDTFKEYTLEDFTNDGNGKYTLELDKLAVGDYTVEETTSTIDGKTVTVKYKVNGGEQTEGTSAKAGVEKDTETTVDFEDDYTKDVGKLVITKTIKGDVTADEAEGALKFKVTAPDDTFKEYTLEDFTNDGNGKYTLELDKLAVGDYTVEETTSTIDGKTVTVKYKVNGGEQTEGTSAKAGVEKDTETKVDFEDDYTKDVGKLIITKTIKGDVTADEAEGALKFKVTAPDDTFKEYTLEDFTNDGNGKYTLELDKLAVGDYTVEETTSTIDGKTVTVKYKVNGGEQTEGTSAKAGVEKDNETTVDFEDEYTDKPEKQGKLVITKILKGMTPEEAKKTLKFKVKFPDGGVKFYSFDDFTEDENGKYVLEINDLDLGEYTVEEITTDENGERVTDTSVTEISEEDDTGNANFGDKVTDETGKLIITKTIKGDVTAEEAEGALKFKVTAPDGSSKEYTLKDFVKSGNKYTLTLDDVKAGKYAVEETVFDISGKNVTVKYSVNGSAQKKGSAANAEVTGGTTTTVDFEDDYTKKSSNTDSSTYPETGDNFNPILWFAIAAISLLGMLAIIFVPARRNKKK